MYSWLETHSLESFTPELSCNSLLYLASLRPENETSFLEGKKITSISIQTLNQSQIFTLDVC